MLSRLCAPASFGNEAVNMSEELSPPTESDWGDWASDLDAAYAHKMFFGKSQDEFARIYAENPIERAGELQFVSDPVFVYYAAAATKYLLSDKSRGDPDAASAFLSLLEARMKDRPNSARSLTSRLRPELDAIASRQSFYEAPDDIYGEFRNRVSALFAPG